MQRPFQFTTLAKSLIELLCLPQPVIKKPIGQTVDLFHGQPYPVKLEAFTCQLMSNCGLSRKCL
jgi:hypothetical protein